MFVVARAMAADALCNNIVWSLSTTIALAWYLSRPYQDYCIALDQIFSFIYIYVFVLVLSI